MNREQSPAEPGRPAADGNEREEAEPELADARSPSIRPLDLEDVLTLDEDELNVLTSAGC